jgi:hypothetical protein
MRVTLDSKTDKLMAPKISAIKVTDKCITLYSILTSRATFLLAIALFTFSYMTVLCMAIPQKIANACKNEARTILFLLTKKIKLLREKYVQLS